MARPESIWLPASHDHPTYIWQEGEGWFWSCPELKFGGGPHQSVDAVQLFIHEYVRLAANRGMVWIFEKPPEAA